MRPMELSSLLVWASLFCALSLIILTMILNFGPSFASERIFAAYKHFLVK